jgi:Protein of unknown function (DUF3570)
MQLSRALAVVVTLAWSEDVAADEGKLLARASTEIAAYSDTDHVAVFTPSVAGHVENPSAGWSVDASYLIDVVSAASVDIISTASRRWTEVRHAAEAGAAYKPGDVGGSVQGSFSSEPDYLSYAAGGSVTVDLADRNASLLLGYGYGHDTIGRSGTPFSVYSHSFGRHAITASMTLLLDPHSVLALGADVAIERGDPSKPYRYIPLFAPSIAPSIPAGATLDLVTRARSPGSVLERLPLARDRFGLSARLAHRVPCRIACATVRIEGRVYHDSWGLTAFSGDGRLLFDLSPRWSLGPHVRYYVQSAVSFFRLAYVATAGDVPALRTGDRELGQLMNLTGGASARWAVGPHARPDAWVLGAHADVTYTGFFDDLYITRRVSSLEALTVEVSW